MSTLSVSRRLAVFFFFTQDDVCRRRLFTIYMQYFGVLQRIYSGEYGSVCSNADRPEWKCQQQQQQQKVADWWWWWERKTRNFMNQTNPFEWIIRQQTSKQAENANKTAAGYHLHSTCTLRWDQHDATCNGSIYRCCHASYVAWCLSESVCFLLCTSTKHDWRNKWIEFVAMRVPVDI